MIIKCDSMTDRESELLNEQKNDKYLCYYYKDDIKNIFDNFLSTQKPLFSLSQKVWNPPTDVYETKDHIIVKMEIAGVDKSDIEVTVEDNILKVRGVRCERAKVNKENYHVMEIHYGNFERVFRLPKNLESKDISASYQDGFLRIAIPKNHAVSQEIVVKIQD